MISRGSAFLGGVVGIALAVAAVIVINALWLLPAARTEGRNRLIVDQAVQSQKEELERKGDDAKLQRLSDYDLCIAYLGRVPECDSLRLQPV
ncbi:hypothetical protein [Rhizobium giardinii]|uniref:Lipopolysaccharide export LptBFGC system permease protein LptF n=1 Tax=Rhizobium giardinii TaxID=56731 RepID=A0A7W8UCM1_9HYPH|nr:hypothetical protein [Rhizobium giardinii]MBB5536932.1 lipopolysaccharide export LptBFGC system permease protein LptF [Rhizobium giardinii]